eukprot:6306112-Lingulodinium_polyedra.AAC.1
MEARLRHQGSPSAAVAADQLAVSVDGDLRGQDAHPLLARHLAWSPDGRTVSATFGARETQERPKTGWGQGVVFED